MQSSKLKSGMSDEGAGEHSHFLFWFATIFSNYFWQINNPASLVM